MSSGHFRAERCDSSGCEVSKILAKRILSIPVARSILISLLITMKLMDYAYCIESNP